MTFEPPIIHGGIPLNTRLLSVQVTKPLPLEECFSVMKDFIQQGLRFGVFPNKNNRFTVWRSPLPGDYIRGHEGEDIMGGIVDPYPPMTSSFFLVFEKGRVISTKETVRQEKETRDHAAQVV